MGKFGVTPSRFGYPKRDAFNNKNRIHLAIRRVVKDMKRNLHELLFLMKNLFFEFVCFPEFENPKNGSRKTKIWKKITNFAKIMKNQQMLVFVTNPATVL